MGESGMIWAYDCDSHVDESELTFSDKYWDPQYLGRRPKVVAGDEDGNLCWLVDSLSFPRIVGPGSATGGTPNSRDGVATDRFHDRAASAALQGMELTLEGIEISSAAARIAMMNQQDLAVQVNFPSFLLTWPFAYDPKIGAAIARSYNSFMADIASQAPDRLKWVTYIDPADVEESVRELRRTKEMGSIGLMLMGTYGDRHLDHPSLEPIWATVAELDMPVAIHPGFCNPGLDNQYTNYTDATNIPFVFTVMLGYYSIMCSGLLDRYPNLRVAFMENGARWVDYMTMRIHETSGLVSRAVAGVQPHAVDEAGVGGSSHARPSPYRSRHLPEEYIRRGQVFVNCEVDERQLPFVIDEYGEDFLLFAADMWHGHNVLDPVQKLLDRQDLSEESKRKLLVDNVARFYGLPVPEMKAAHASK